MGRTTDKCFDAPLGNSAADQRVLDVYRKNERRFNHPAWTREAVCSTTLQAQAEATY